VLCLPAQPRRNGVRGSESTLTRRLRDLPRFQQNACSACRELPRRGALRECSNIKLLAVGRTRVAIAPGASPFLRGAASRQYTCVSFQFSLSFRLTPKQTMLLGKPHPLSRFRTPADTSQCSRFFRVRRLRLVAQLEPVTQRTSERLRLVAVLFCRRLKPSLWLCSSRWLLRGSDRLGGMYRNSPGAIIAFAIPDPG